MTTTIKRFTFEEAVEAMCDFAVKRGSQPVPGGSVGFIIQTHYQGPDPRPSITASLLAVDVEVTE